MDDITIDFVEFAKAVARNEFNYGSWQRYAVTHYADEKIEEARREIVRICNDDDSIGSDLWPITDAAAIEILRVVDLLSSKTKG